MTEPERLTGEEAREATSDLAEREMVLAAEGGSAWCGEGGGAYYFVYGDWAFAPPGDENRDFQGSALRFPDRASRDQWMQEHAPMDSYLIRGWTVEPPGTSTSSMLGVGGLILSAAEGWLRDLSDAETDCSSLKEADLQKALFERMAKHSGLRKELPIQSKDDLPGAIPGWNPGGVDLVVDSEEGPVWVELKWAKSYDTLFNCLWDAAKLAGAVRAEAAIGGYLVAGAPASDWAKDHPYQDLFTFHTWEDGSIVSSFPSSWRGWMKENEDTFPSQIVDPVQILPFGFARGGPDDWEIRVARVVAPGEATVDLSSLDLSS